MRGKRSVGNESPEFSHANPHERKWRSQDEQIESTVHMLLRQVCLVLSECGETTGHQIEVSVNDQLVTLRGAVECLKVKRLAENVARSVSGVRGVLSQIEIVAAPAPPAQPRAVSASANPRGETPSLISSHQ